MTFIHLTVRKNQKIFHPCCDQYCQGNYCYEYGCTAVRLYDCMTVWLYDCTTVRLYDCSYLVAADFITCMLLFLRGIYLVARGLYIFMWVKMVTHIFLFVVCRLFRHVRVWDADTNHPIPIVEMSLTRILMVKVVSLLARDAWTM